MGELRLSMSGYLAHEVRILQDNVRIFDPSQPDPVHIPFIFLSFAASHDSHTCKRLEEGQIDKFLTLISGVSFLFLDLYNFYLAYQLVLCDSYHLTLKYFSMYRASFAESELFRYAQRVMVSWCLDLSIQDVENKNSRSPSWFFFLFLCFLL